MTELPAALGGTAIHRTTPLSRAAILSALFRAAPATAQESAPAFIGSAACADCHKEVAERWAGSHHALAWTKPGLGTVVADFDGTEFAHDGPLSRFRIDEDGSYHVEVAEKDGTTTDYPVHSVAGIEPLQQYLLEIEPGQLQSFDVVWDTERGRWFHLYPDQDLPPDDGLHWTGPLQDPECSLRRVPRPGPPGGRPVGAGPARPYSAGLGAVDRRSR